ncbi:MAG TPA: DUF4388 domain-containing protein [Thermoanaerobaculia bacterium]|nr:DUF4388 domain-containing protein [Thermoanaerobaculia bacterium]
MRSAAAVRFLSQYSPKAIIGGVIMGIVGNLRTMQLEELLQWLSQSKKNGTLEIVNGRVEKKVFFKDGLILSSASNQPEEYLGHFLVSRGLITEDQLNKAIAMQEQTRMLLGKILVSHGALTEENLHSMLRLKAEESIYEIFSWREGDFRFLDDVLPDGAMVPMRLDVTGIVMEGVQRLDEWKRIRQVIPHEAVIPVGLIDFSKASKLGAGERRILELVNDERTIEEIREATRSTEYQVSKLFFDQYQLGRMKFVKLRWAAGGSPAGGIEDGVPTATALLQAGQVYLAQNDYDAALRHLRAARALEPENTDALASLNHAEKKIREEIEKAGVSLGSVPQLAASIEQLTAAKLSPQEGFMLTRVNGSYDIQSILKITPMPQLDALMIFWKLASQGFIRLLPPRTPGPAGRGAAPAAR